MLVDRLLVGLVALCAFHGHATGDVVFDNLNSPSFGQWYGETGELLGQQFLLGDYNTVSGVSLDVRAIRSTKW